jgi:hypothetical protein
MAYMDPMGMILKFQHDVTDFFPEQRGIEIPQFRSILGNVEKPESWHVLYPDLGHHVFRQTPIDDLLPPGISITMQASPTYTVKVDQTRL